MNTLKKSDFEGKTSQHSSLRKSLGVAVILGGLFLASCGGGSNGSVGGVATGVYSSGSSGGVTAMAAATITGSTATPTINATLYIQSNGDLTLVDLTNEITCTGTGTTSGSTITATLTCNGQKVSYTKVPFTATMNGSTLTGSYTPTTGTVQTFTIGTTTVTSQSSIPIDNTTFTVPTSGCAANSSMPGTGVWEGEMVMCPTGGSGSSGSNITIGSAGAITGGYLNFTFPSMSPQTIAANCSLTVSGSQTITITGGTLTALAGLTNVYSVASMAGSMTVNMNFALSGTGCAADGITSSTFPTTFSMTSSFTMTTGTASIVNMNNTDVLVLGGSVSTPAIGSQTAQTFSVPNTAI